MNHPSNDPRKATASDDSVPRRHALSEPMVWLTIGLPAASVVFAFWLLAAAVRTGGADEIAENVQRTADVQVADLGPDAKAHALNLAAVLHVDAKGVAVFPAQGAFARGQTLVLTLSHPADMRQDRRLVLQPDASGWRIAGDLRKGHDWIARLEPLDGSWRLRGRLKADGLAVRLDPALGD